MGFRVVRRTAAVALIGWLLAVAAPAAAAGSVQLRIADGRVWLAARDATVAQILAAWTRVGGTEVVNADSVTGRVTLELDGVPESDAIDLILRPAAGFVARRHETPPPPGASMFQSIHIMAASAARGPAPPVPEPVIAPPPPQGIPIAPGVERILGPDGQPVPDDQDGAPEPRPETSLPPGFAEPPRVSNPAPAEPPPTPTPSAPVGVPVPGMISPPPTPPKQ